MFNSHVGSSMDDYLKGGRWKCAKSPTGSHYWKSNTVGKGALVCEHCKEHRVLRRGIP